MFGFSRLVSSSVAHRLSRIGIASPSPVQSAAIPAILDDYRKNDVFIQAPPGSGKTIAYLSSLSVAAGPRAAKEPRFLVLSPTRELAVQLQQSLSAIAPGKSAKRPDPPTVSVLTGSSRAVPGSLRRKKDSTGARSPSRLASHGRVPLGDIVIATPAAARRRIGELTRGSVKMVVVDEADFTLAGPLPPLARDGEDGGARSLPTSSSSGSSSPSSSSPSSSSSSSSASSSSSFRQSRSPYAEPFRNADADHDEFATAEEIEDTLGAEDARGPDDPGSGEAAPSVRRGRRLDGIVAKRGGGDARNSSGPERGSSTVHGDARAVIGAVLAADPEDARLVVVAATRIDEARTAALRVARKAVGRGRDIGSRTVVCAHQWGGDDATVPLHGSAPAAVGAGAGNALADRTGGPVRQGDAIVHLIVRFGRTVPDHRRVSRTIAALGAVSGGSGATHDDSNQGNWLTTPQKLSARSILIFRDRAHDVEKLHHSLRALRDVGQIYKCLPRMSSRERRNAVLEFRRNSWARGSARKAILIGTDTFSRGVDVPGVDTVVMFHPSPSADSYFHRAGRVGRLLANHPSLNKAAASSDRSGSSSHDPTATEDDGARGSDSSSISVGEGPEPRVLPGAVVTIVDAEDADDAASIALAAGAPAVHICDVVHGRFVLADRRMKV